MFTTNKNIIDLLEPQKGGIILFFGNSERTNTKMALHLLDDVAPKNEFGVYISLGAPPAPTQLKGHLHAHASSIKMALTMANILTDFVSLIVIDSFSHSLIDETINVGTLFYQLQKSTSLQKCWVILIIKKELNLWRNTNMNVLMLRAKHIVQT